MVLMPLASYCPGSEDGLWWMGMAGVDSESLYLCCQVEMAGGLISEKNDQERASIPSN